MINAFGRQRPGERRPWPLNQCRELTAAEKATLKPISDFVKTKADARIWATSRYDARGLGTDQIAGERVEHELRRPGRWAHDRRSRGCAGAMPSG